MTIPLVSPCVTMSVCLLALVTTVQHRAIGGDKYPTVDRMPVDRHFLGAVIAPRAYLGIMGAEKPAFNRGHVEAYKSLIPVYDWLGARQNLGLYDHAPRGHGVNLDDLLTVLDFSNQAFYATKPASDKQFDQIRSPSLDGSE